MARQKGHQRIVIYAADISGLMGVTTRTARKRLKVMKQAFGKQKHQFLTIQEFCAFSGIAEQTVVEYIRL